MSRLQDFQLGVERRALVCGPKASVTTTSMPFIETREIITSQTTPLNPSVVTMTSLHPQRLLERAPCPRRHVLVKKHFVVAKLFERLVDKRDGHIHRRSTLLLRWLILFGLMYFGSSPNRPGATDR
jgi:hypothetical protein